MWDLTPGNGEVTATKTIVKCNTKEFDVTETTGIALVEKLKAIARDNQIGKFDIFDNTGNLYHPPKLKTEVSPHLSQSFAIM